MSRASPCQAAPVVRRRVPRQQRGRRTRDALVTATAELIDAVGYERLTTKAIAARAGTSIGAFYQFFANKDDAIEALAERYRGRVRASLAAAIGDPRRDGVTAAWVSQIIRGLGHIHRDMPGFRGVWSGRLHGGPLGERARELRHEVFDALDRTLGDAFPNVSVEVRRRALTIALETAYLLLSHIEDREFLLAELQRLLGLYLGSYFSAPSTETAALA
jgi:AcrR family transcriptional regulator